LPDSAIILISYEKWGENCLAKLLGEFAFAIWDDRRRQLFCARDCSGNKSLFYFHGARIFAFATGLKGLLAHPDVPRKINETRIADLVLQLSTEKTTLYKDVFGLPLMHALTVTPSGLSLRQYWFPKNIPRLHLNSDQEYVEAFNEIFSEAVRCRLRSVKPVGVLLSGGLDSASIACIAARQLKKNGQTLEAFCSVPLKEFTGRVGKGRLADETPYIKAVQHHVDNLRLHFSRAEGRTSLSDFKLDVSLFSQLSLGAEFRYWAYALLEMAQQNGIGVILTGNGGNFTISFNGDGYLASLARQGKWLTMAREFYRRCTARKENFLKTLRPQILEPLIPMCLWAAYFQLIKGTATRPGMDYLSASFARRINIENRFHLSEKSMRFRLLPDTRALRCLSINPKRTEVADIWATLGYHFGCEVRDPTADKRVIEFCMSIPDNQYVCNGSDRMLVRRAMEGILPPAVQWRTNRGRIAADIIHRVLINEDEFRSVLCQIERSQTVGRYLDTAQIRKDIDEMYSVRGSGWRKTAALSALLTAKFLLQLDEHESVSL
jgi:asparagine synthase (glutamine-hydrolysing)